MTIVTRLKVAALAPLSMALTVGVVVLFAHRAIQTAQERGRFAERVIRSMNDLHSLVGIYSLHYEERARRQFLAEHAAIAPLLASIRFSDPGPQRLLDALRENTDTMKETFLRMGAIHERAESSPRAEALARDADRLAGQLLVRSRQAVSEGLRLERLVKDQIAATQALTNLLVPSLIFIVTLPLTLLLLRMMSRIGHSLATLRRGAEAVGQGSLAHRIALSGNDELAGLARAFDQMTENLQALTVSRNDLEREVLERRRAEHALEQATEDLAAANAQLERKVQERTAELQELVGELEHFSYTITHDMRAPLRAMTGFGELVNDLCTECEHQDRKEFIRRIMTAAGRMDCLITDALNYSRSVRQELPVEEVDAGTLLRGMLDSYPELQASKARISIEGQLPVVLGNQAGLTQCFSNLLANAVKFVKPGQTPEIRVWAEQRDGWARIWVEDNGIGISKEMLPRAFDMFSRGSKDYPGTGIGLALVRKVSQRMGGRAGAQSEEGKGSRFWLELRPGGRAGRSEERNNTAPAGTGGKKVGGEEEQPLRA
jgi:signal transduction histidine kinase